MKNAIEKIEDRVLFRLKKFTSMPERLYQELGFISEKGVAHELLFISDIIRYLRSQDIMVSPGFGPATCSLVCYGLGITDVNPLDWNLPFESFVKFIEHKEKWDIRTGTGAFDKILEFVNLSCKYHSVKTYDNIRLNGMVLIEDAEPFELHMSIIESPVLETIKNLSAGDTINPFKVKLTENILDIFRFADTDNIWQFASDRTKKKLLNFQPESFSDLYLIYALDFPYRDNVWKEVLRRKQENDIPSTGIAAIDNILMESYGMLVYKEQQVLIEQYFMTSSEDYVTLETIRRLIADRADTLFPKGSAIATVKISLALAYYQFKTNGPKQYVYPIDD